MESRGDSWESVGWEAASQRPGEDADRDEVLRLARQLAESRERQNVEALLQVEDLKRALRERASDVARRELEVERRIRELDDLDGRGREGRRLRVRRGERPQEVHKTSEDERLARRESEVQKRLDALVPRERAIAGRETALRARELEVQEAELALSGREQEVTALEDHERQLEASRAEISRLTDELVARTATLEAAEQELDAERRKVIIPAREHAQRSDSGLGEPEVGGDEPMRRLAAWEKELEERAQAVEARELRLVAREQEAAVVEERSTADGERSLSQLEAQLAAREAELLGREAELLRLQSGLAAQQESIRRRERALEDAERVREREQALPATPYVSFTEGLEAFSGGRPRSR